MDVRHMPLPATEQNHGHARGHDDDVQGEPARAEQEAKAADHVPDGTSAHGKPHQAGSTGDEAVGTERSQRAVGEVSGQKSHRKVCAYPRHE